jgi:hypothetical protein
MAYFKEMLLKFFYVHLVKKCLKQGQARFIGNILQVAPIDKGFHNPRSIPWPLLGHLKDSIRLE